MHPDPAFRWEDRAAMRAYVAEAGFGALFAATPQGPHVAHVPALFVAEDRLGFHLARGNALARHLDGAETLFVVQGPDAYISPDWYGLPDQVPTWNYCAVELQGRARRMDDGALVDLLDRLSAEHEARLAPKPGWMRGKMAPGLFDRMLAGIVGFTLDVAAWRGTRKLGQNKPAHARLAAADALEAAGGRAVARLMREAAR